MALIDVICEDGHLHEVNRSIHDWPKTPACPEPGCGKPTEQTLRPRQTRWQVDPIVVFRAPDGTYRFPGDRDDSGARKYEAMGYERQEIRGAAEMRQFEGRMEKSEYSRAQQRIERQQEQREEREHEMRSQLHHAMRSMSPRGRAVAEAMIRKHDAERKAPISQVGFHSEIYSFNRSNRAEGRDASGRRFRD